MPSLWGVTIPSPVTGIGEGDSADCGHPGRITIPSLVTEIGWRSSAGRRWRESQMSEGMLIVNHIPVEVEDSAEHLSVPDTVKRISAGGACRLIGTEEVGARRRWR